jgi:peptidyl-prolyl cis-trans isomerase D
MLQQMRKVAKSRVSSILLVGLAASFGVWGIADIFRGGPTDTSVASVGDTKIPAEVFQRDYQNIMRSRGQLTPDQARQQGLPDRALQSLINQTALDSEVNRLGIVVGDTQINGAIRSVQAFSGPLGTFDRATFLQRLGQYGFTEQAFIETVRNDSARQQVLDAARNGFAVPPGLARALFAFLNERRAVQYVEVPDSAAGTIADPTDAQLNDYVKAHPDRFSYPEYRSLTYAAVGPEDLTGQISVTDDQIKQEYASRKDDPQYAYIIPEKRDVEQINFHDEAGAKAARAKIDSGTAFDALAQSLGGKPLDLGTVTQSELGDRGAAVFALPQGGVSQPIKNLSGYVLLHVSKITPGATKTLADVKEDIRKDLAAKLDKAKVEDIANAYTDASSGGLDIAGAAKKVGMRVVHVPAVDANGLARDGSKAAIPDDPDFLVQIFKAEPGQEGDPFEAKDAHEYVLKIESDTPSKLKPLSAVRPQATAMWLADARQKALAKKAQALAAQANAAHDLGPIAKSLNATVQTSGVLSRDKASGDMPLDLITTIFSVPPGTAVSGASAKGTYIVARVSGVSHPPPPIGDPNYQKFVQQVSAGTGEDIGSSIALAERAKQGVKINQKQVDQVTGAGGEGS